MRAEGKKLKGKDFATSKGPAEKHSSGRGLRAGRGRAASRGRHGVGSGVRPRALAFTLSATLRTVDPSSSSSSPDAVRRVRD